jgi:hypothetical protein
MGSIDEQNQKTKISRYCPFKVYSWLYPWGQPELSFFPKFRSFSSLTLSFKGPSGPMVWREVSVLRPAGWELTWSLSAVYSMFCNVDLAEERPCVCLFLLREFVNRSVSAQFTCIIYLCTSRLFYCFASVGEYWRLMSIFGPTVMKAMSKSHISSFGGIQRFTFWGVNRWWCLFQCCGSA